MTTLSFGVIKIQHNSSPHSKLNVLNQNGDTLIQQIKNIYIQINNLEIYYFMQISKVFDMEYFIELVYFI